MDVDATSAQASDDDTRVVALAAEVASLRGELARAQSALTNLRIRYHQLVEELHLLKRRLIVAKAERLDDVVAAQLAFDKLLAETQAIEKVLDAADSAEGDNDDDDAQAEPKDERRRRTDSPPTGRRKLDESGLPVVRVEIPNPEFEGKVERIGVDETSRVAYERGGYRRLVVARIVYKETTSDESPKTDGGTAAAPKEPAFRIVTAPRRGRS